MTNHIFPETAQDYLRLCAERGAISTLAFATVYNDRAQPRRVHTYFNVTGNREAREMIKSQVEMHYGFIGWHTMDVTKPFMIAVLEIEKEGE
jgi:hypothetical protein